MDYSSAAVSGAAAGAAVAYYVCLIAMYVLLVIAQWKIFAKAGEAGWKSLIPFYNLYILFKIADGNGIKFLLLLIPVVNVVFAIIMELKLARAFGKGTGFAIGLIFLAPIFMLILGFGDAQYIGPDGKAAA